MPQSISRRRLLKQVGSGLVLIPLVTLPERSAFAAEKISLDHPSAKALGYVHVAEETDTTKFPKRAGEAGAKQFCDNCSQYKETEPGWGTCTIFPNFLVAGPGWCNVWVPVT